MASRYLNCLSRIIRLNLFNKMNMRRCKKYGLWQGARKHLHIYPKCVVCCQIGTEDENDVLLLNFCVGYHFAMESTSYYSMRKFRASETMGPLTPWWEMRNRGVFADQRLCLVRAVKTWLMTQKVRVCQKAHTSYQLLTSSGLVCCSVWKERTTNSF